MVWSFFLGVLGVTDFRVAFDLLGLIAASWSAVGCYGLRAVGAVDAQRVGWSSVLLVSERKSTD